MPDDKIVSRYRKLAALARDPNASEGERKRAAERMTALLIEHPDVAVRAAAKDAPPPPPPGTPGAGPTLPPEAQAVLHALGRGLRQGADTVVGDLTATWTEATTVARTRARERATHTARSWVDRIFDALDSDDD